MQPPVAELNSAIGSVLPGENLFWNQSRRKALDNPRKEDNTMIFADKVIHHRKKNGWTQEELAEKMGVSRQSISKWEGAQSVPDLEKILKLSNLFGVSTDYLLKDELEPEEFKLPATVDVPEERADVRRVSLEEATQYLTLRQKAAQHIALGVLLCILGAIFLIGMGGAAEFEYIAMSVDTAGTIGLIGALILVAGGVALFILTGLRHNDFEYLEKEIFETAYGVDGMVKERRNEYRDTYNRWTVMSIMLLIFAFVPLFLGGLFSDQEGIQMLLLLLTLLMIGAGVYILVRINVIWDSFKKLLQTDDYDPKQKSYKESDGMVMSVYWPLVVVIYLVWSFMSGDWHITWVVWPIAAILTPVVLGIERAIKG